MSGYLWRSMIMWGKKNDIMPFVATRMELETHHPEWSKSERERQIPYDITYIWNLIYGTNEHFHRKENHGHGEQTCGCPQGGGGDWEFGVNRCKLLLLEWISNGILLYSTGNYGHLWWSMIKWKKWMYIFICDYVICCTVENWENSVNQL